MPDWLINLLQKHGQVDQEGNSLPAIYAAFRNGSLMNHQVLYLYSNSCCNRATPLSMHTSATAVSITSQDSREKVSHL